MPADPPVTAEDLLGLFRAAQSGTCRVEFGNLTADARTVLPALVRELERLVSIDAKELHYKARRPGASAADCIGFLRLLMGKLSGSSLQETMTRRMVDATIAHLEELIGRRSSADAEEQRERKAREEAARAQREQAKRHWEEKRKEGYRAAYEEVFREAFEEAMYHGNSFRWQNFQQTPTPKGKRSWHEVLGVPVTASKEAIQKAARRLRAKYHPDRYKEADAHERMVEINVATDEGLGR